MKLTKERLAALRVVAADGPNILHTSMSFGRDLNALTVSGLIRRLNRYGYLITPEGENCLKEHE